MCITYKEGDYLKKKTSFFLLVSVLMICFLFGGCGKKTEPENTGNAGTLIPNSTVQSEEEIELELQQPFKPEETISNENVENMEKLESDDRVNVLTGYELE